MFRFVRPYKWRLFFFAYTAIGFALFNSAPFLVVRQFLNIINDPKPGRLSELWFVVWLMLAAWVLRVYFLVRRAIATNYLSQAVVKDATNRVMAHVMRQRLSFFDRWRSGELLSRITADAGSVALTVNLFTIFAREPITIAFLLAVAFYFSWELALIGVIGFPLAAWPLAVFSRRIRKKSRRLREAFAERADALIRILRGVRVVKAFRREDHEIRRFGTTTTTIFDQGMRVERSGAALRGLVEMVNGVGAVAVIIVGGLFVFKGYITSDALVAFFAALWSIHRPARALGEANVQVQTALPAAERLFEVLDVEEQLPVPKDPVRAGPPREAIRLRDVSFSYGREQVLRDVSMDVEAGRVTAVVGPSGAGKSSVVNLVARFYDPVAGSVEADGVDLGRVDPAGWLDMLGIVTQEPLLFNLSIRENIRYGRLDATDEEVEEAARLAQIHDEIMRFPQGYDTPAGEGGSALSGGQRQRVSIARALVRNPAVLLLDEATSSLDSASERDVQRAIERAEVGRTTLVVAHRLSTVRNADRIYVLVNGAIEVSGRHEELLETSPTYRRMWEIQQGKAVAANDDQPPIHADGRR
jgi:subfamily B ATP-binding cassette protein MsbA